MPPGRCGDYLHESTLYGHPRVFPFPQSSLLGPLFHGGHYPNVLLSNGQNFPLTPSQLATDMDNFKQETRLLLDIQKSLVAMDNFTEEDVCLFKIPVLETELDNIKVLKNEYQDEVEDFIDKLSYRLG